MKVWREPGERYHDSKISEHDRYGGGSIVVWGGISWQGKTDLHVFHNGTLTAECYMNEILDVNVKPYAGAVGRNFILMALMPIHTGQGFSKVTWNMNQFNV